VSRRRSIFPLVLVIILALAGAILVRSLREPVPREVPAGPPLLETDFELSPQEQGWVYDDTPGDAGRDEWTDKVALSGIRSLSVQHGHWWETPTLETDPLSYYSITFKSLSSVSSFLGVRFFDQDGNLMTSDCFCEIEPFPGWHYNEIVVRCHPLARSTRVMFQPRSEAPRGTGRESPLYVDDVVIRPVHRAYAAAWADCVYATMRTLEYTPRQGRWEFLPKTMSALRAGGPIRIVVLGDSIACDTANSTFDVLIERRYPSARLLVIPSTRRNTGCEYYSEEGRVKSYVLDHRPDLLVIGGINNRGQANIREVIRQVREQSDTEIIVLTGAFGIRFMSAAQGRGQWTHPLSSMAREERVAFLDMGLAVGNYLLNCGKPYERFLRDTVHPNDRGKQLMGRILERYFADDVQ